MDNIFGNKYKLKISGASHESAMTLELFGMPEGVYVDRELIDKDLQRRHPCNEWETPRNEKDNYRIVSGVFDNGFTDGNTIKVIVENNTFKSGDYKSIENIYRPSHADFTYKLKYGESIPAGGGIMSGRMTVLYVIAGAFAKMVLGDRITFDTWAYSIGDYIIPKQADALPADVSEFLKRVRSEGDSVGGSVRCIASGAPAGLGEPIFDKLHARLAYAMMSIPSARAFEIGKGKESATMRGSVYNDCYCWNDQKGLVRPAKNDSGGVLGGISTGEDIIITVSFKPIPSISKPQHTVDKDGNQIELRIAGSHDSCIVPRAAVIVEALTAAVLLDFILRA